MNGLVNEKTTNIGQWLKNGRQIKGYTLQDVADLTKGACSVSYVSRLERNARKNPSIDKLKMLAEVLGLDIRDILDESFHEADNEMVESLQHMREYVERSVVAIKELIRTSNKLEKVLSELPDDERKSTIQLLSQSLKAQERVLLKETAYIKIDLEEDVTL